MIGDHTGFIHQFLPIGTFTSAHAFQFLWSEIVFINVESAGSDKYALLPCEPSVIECPFLKLCKLFGIHYRELLCGSLQTQSIRRGRTPCDPADADFPGAVANTPVIGTLSPLRHRRRKIYNGVQTARDGEGAMTGFVVYAVEIFRRPEAAIARRLRQQSNIPAPTTSRPAWAGSQRRKPASTRVPMRCSAQLCR